MKTTGIVRRVDDLGRVIIPREIRKNLRIIDGTPLEIYVDDNGIYFKKYHTNIIDELKVIQDTIENDFDDYEQQLKARKIIDKATKDMKKIVEDEN